MPAGLSRRRGLWNPGQVGTVIGILIGLVLLGLFLVVGVFRYAAYDPRFGRWLIRTFPRYGSIFVDEGRGGDEDRRDLP